MPHETKQQKISAIPPTPPMMDHNVRSSSGSGGSGGGNGAGAIAGGGTIACAGTCAGARGTAAGAGKAARCRYGRNIQPKNFTLRF